MANRPSPISEAIDSIGSAFVLLGRCIAEGLRATKHDYVLTPDAEEASDEH